MAAGGKGTGRAGRYVAAGGDGLAISPGQPDGTRRGQPCRCPAICRTAAIIKRHYDQIFAGRPAAEAQELSALLPLRYAELKDAAAAVTRAEDWLTSVENVRRADSDGTGSIRALELLALRRRAFVQIARDYNRRIARYVELATPGEIGPDRLIGMLIKRAGASTATRPSGGRRR